MEIPEDMTPMTIHPSHYGDVAILSYENHKTVHIKFLETGYRTIAHSGNIRRMTVKDVTAKSIMGIACFGDGPYKAQISGHNTTCYNAWKNMLLRCYNPSANGYHRYGGRGVFVCDEWLNFQVFAEWYHENFKEGLALDKDMKIEGNLCYSQDTCLFVTKKDNTAKARAKTYYFINPNGYEQEIYNLRAFCAENDLNLTNMHRVYSGDRKSHKKWRKAQ